MKRDELNALGLCAEAVDSVMTLYGRDIEKHKAAAQTWQEKHAADTAALQAKLDSAAYHKAVDTALQDVAFSSNSAKTAFCTALETAALPVENDVFTGFSDFLSQYRTDDPAAFAAPPAPKAPILVQPAPGLAENTLAGAALRTAFGL